MSSPAKEDNDGGVSWSSNDHTISEMMTFSSTTASFMPVKSSKLEASSQVVIGVAPFTKAAPKSKAIWEHRSGTRVELDIALIFD